MFEKEPLESKKDCPNCEGKGTIPALTSGGTPSVCWVCAGQGCKPEKKKEKEKKDDPR